MADLCYQFELHASPITKCKRHFLEHAADVLRDARAQMNRVDLLPLHARTGQLTLENDFFSARSPRRHG